MNREPSSAGDQLELACAKRAEREVPPVSHSGVIEAAREAAAVMERRSEEGLLHLPQRSSAAT
jgi:hypothetical protein